jgi:ATP-dependent Lhr-like helicase
LARRQFREIARIAGLTLRNHPGAEKSSRQLQASSGLLFDVLRRYEPGSLLLAQAEREALEGQFEYTRLVRVLERLGKAKPLLRRIPEPTPLAFPLVVERIGARLSTESLADRVERMKARWEAGSKRGGTATR